MVLWMQEGIPSNLKILARIRAVSSGWYCRRNQRTLFPFPRPHHSLLVYPLSPLSPLLINNCSKDPASFLPTSLLQQYSINIFTLLLPSGNFITQHTRAFPLINSKQHRIYWNANCRRGCYTKAPYTMYTEPTHNEPDFSETHNFYNLSTKSFRFLLHFWERTVTGRRVVKSSVFIIHSRWKTFEQLGQNG